MKINKLTIQEFDEQIKKYLKGDENNTTKINQIKKNIIDNFMVEYYYKKYINTRSIPIRRINNIKQEYETIKKLKENKGKVDKEIYDGKMNLLKKIKIQLKLYYNIQNYYFLYNKYTKISHLNNIKTNSYIINNIFTPPLVLLSISLHIKISDEHKFNFNKFTPDRIAIIYIISNYIIDKTKSIKQKIETFSDKISIKNICVNRGENNKSKKDKSKKDKSKKDKSIAFGHIKCTDKDYKNMKYLDLIKFIFKEIDKILDSNKDIKKELEKEINKANPDAEEIEEAIEKEEKK
jgi:hypothetical protein